MTDVVAESRAKPVDGSGSRSVFAEQFARVVRDPLALVGLCFLLALVFMAAFAPWITPQNPYDLAQLDFMQGMLPPLSPHASGGYVYLLGTDSQGRDMYSAIVYGLRISIGVGVASTLIACFIGAVVGVASGYFGGKFDAVAMRLVDLQLSYPAILIALILLAIFGRGIDKVIIALVIVQWAYYARTARGAALVERNKEYVEAAICLKVPTWRILVGHILPNCLSPLIVLASVQAAGAIALEATLSFLGVGVAVTQPSLGMLISDGYDYMFSGKYWVSVFPGLALVLVIVSINLVADRLRDVLNPNLADSDG